MFVPMQAAWVLRAVPRRVFILIGLALLPVPTAAQSCPGTLALVLSGGGAKGLAHIGLLQVLDSMGVRPDLVVGTSMGSVVGAMYASGYSGNQIADQARALRLAELFAADGRAPRSLGWRRPLVLWEPGAGGFHTGQSGSRQAGVNAALNGTLLRGNLLARGDFDSLSIPFRAVATDIRTREQVVLSGGDLARAVRASMAIPLVFDPERIDGRDLIDGGLAANVPVAAARRAGATRVIISDVSWHPPDSVEADNPLVVADLLVAYLFTQAPDSLGPDDRLVRPAVDSFATLDFAPSRIDALIARGHEAARLAFEAHPLPCSPPADSGRTRPDYRLRGVRAEGVGSAEALLLRRQLGLADGPLDVPLLRERLAAFGENEEYRELWLRPSGPPDSLRFDLAVRPAPARLGAAGLAYDNDLGGQMWLGGVDRGTAIPGLESSLTLALAELRQEVTLGFRREVLGPFLRRPFLTATVAREQVRQFTPAGDLVAPVRTREARGVLGLEHRFGREWLLSGGGLAYAWDSPGANHSHALGGFVQLWSGPRYRPSGLWGEAEFTTAYSRVHVQARRVIPAVGFRFTPEVRFGWGRHLPLVRTFELGGLDGFPGMNIGELRGDRELYAQFIAAHRLLGPIDLRASLASGQTAFGGSTLPRGRWQAGGRVGLAAETPIGPIRVEYGVAREARNGFFVRLGEWF
jgi:predicted acylesterase/phospholipase RssA